MSLAEEMTRGANKSRDLHAGKTANPHVIGHRVEGGAQTKSRESHTGDRESTHMFGQRRELGRKQIRQVRAGEANLSRCSAKLIGEEARTSEIVAQRRAQTKTVRLMDKRADGQS